MDAQSRHQHFFNPHPYSPTLFFGRQSRPNKNLSLRQNIAWRLRRLADRIDQSISYSLSGTMHSTLTQADVDEGMIQGFITLHKYLADLAQDRSLVGGDTTHNGTLIR